MMVTVTITEAASFHLLADAPAGAPLRVRRTRAGDAWDRAQADSCGVPATSGANEPGRVSLGLPGLRVGAPVAGVTTSPIYDPSDGERR